VDDAPGRSEQAPEVAACVLLEGKKHLHIDLNDVVYRDGEEPPITMAIGMVISIPLR